MNIGTFFINAAKQNPTLRKTALEAISVLYNTAFALRAAPTLTSDKLQISTNTRHDRWYEDFNEIRRYVAKQNHDGLWDIQRISHCTQNLEAWTNREMVRLGANIEDVRAFFNTQNRFISPSGREITLKNCHDEDSVLSKGDRVRTDYILRQNGNYRKHPAWAPSAPAGKAKDLTP